MTTPVTPEPVAKVEQQMYVLLGFKVDSAQHPVDQDLTLRTAADADAEVQRRGATAKVDYWERALPEDSRVQQPPTATPTKPAPPISPENPPTTYVTPAKPPGGGGPFIPQTPATPFQPEPALVVPEVEPPAPKPAYETPAPKPFADVPNPKPVESPLTPNKEGNWGE